MTPQFSFELPTHRVEAGGDLVSGEAVMDLARRAEQAGFAACHVTDHPAPDSKWLGAGGHHALDPFVALSFAGAATSSIRLLTNIYVIAYRNPFLAAKSVQSLAVLSGERLILGTGAGYLKPEFKALGVEFDERNDLLDEALEVLCSVLTGEDTTFAGRHFAARGVQLRPVPKERPPIWIGGNSTRSIRRAVTQFEGWAPFATGGYGRASRTAELDGIDDLEARIAQARAIAAEIGREAPLDICYSAGGLGDPEKSVEERRDLIGRLAEAGVTWLPVPVPGESRIAVADGLAAFADAFID